MIIRSGFLGSPIPGRKRFPSEPPHQQYNTSPLVLQRFYHQHLPLQNHQHQLNNYPIQQSSYPHQQISDISNDSPKLEDSNASSGVVKKRFASYLKFHLGGNEARRNLPPSRPHRHASPGPAPNCHYSPASQSPEPPPRLNRVTGNSLDGAVAMSSPLSMRRNFLDVSPVRRGFVEGSPSLSRR